MLTEKMEGFLDRSMTAGKYWYNVCGIILLQMIAILFIVGITILEVVISVMCLQTVIHVFQTISLVFVTYVVFKNPVEITSGLFAFVLIIFLNGWLGLLCGRYLLYLIWIDIIISNEFSRKLRRISQFNVIILI